MKKTIRIAAILLACVITVFTLSSGISSDRSGGYKDLVDELYDAGVKQNDNLKSIEEGIHKFYKKKEEAMEKYNSYVSLNNRYYADARANLNRIGDAAVKQKATDLVSKSEAAYKAKLNDWYNAIAAVNINEQKLNDLHQLLKLSVATPLAERGQAGSFPDNSKLKEADKDLQKIIEQIKAITQ